MPKIRKVASRDTRDLMRELLSAHSLTPPQAAILMAIHLRMGQDGAGWVSQEHLKQFTKLGQTSITTNTKSLEALGVLKIDRRNQQRGQKPLPNLYRLVFKTEGALSREGSGAPSPGGSGALSRDGTKGPLPKDPYKKRVRRKKSDKREKISRKEVHQEKRRALSPRGSAHFDYLDGLKDSASVKSLLTRFPDLDRPAAFDIFQDWKAETS